MNKTKMNLEALFQEAEIKTKKSKSEVPDYPEKMELVDEISKIYNELVEAEGLYKTLQEKLINEIRHYHIEMLKRQYASSVRVYGKNDHSVLVSWKDKYYQIPLEFKDTIKNLVKDKYDDYFKTNITIKVKDTDTETVKKLIEKIGTENFAKFFEVKRFIEPTKTFTQNRYKELDKDTNIKLNEIIKQIISLRVEK